MARTLAQIKQELSDRFISKEYLPEYIKRTEDLRKFADAVGEFLAKYVLQIEELNEIYHDADLLRNFLLSKKMYLSGDEDLSKLQSIAKNRYRILLARGTMDMQYELRRLCNDKNPGSSTSVEYRAITDNGWIIERTSPCYRNSSISLNTCYLEIKDLVIFNLKNLSNTYTNSEIKEIVKYYFEPKHIRSLYNFIV